MEHFQDYHNLYNKLDVLLLADVFENFRDICIKNYNLDPAHYYTAPGLAWDASLKITDGKLELLSDIEMLLMVEKGIRGEFQWLATVMERLIINIWVITLMIQNPPHI